MANKPPIVNFADAKRRRFGHGEAFKATTARIGAELGAEQIGCTLVELEPGTAHQIINCSDAPLRYLAISQRADAEVAEYPDSGKIGAYGRNDGGLAFLAPMSAGVDYFDGEDGDP